MPKSPNAKFLADPTRVIYLYSTGYFNALGAKTGITFSRLGKRPLGNTILPDASTLASQWNIGFTFYISPKRFPI